MSREKASFFFFRTETSDLPHYVFGGAEDTIFFWCHYIYSEDWKIRNHVAKSPKCILLLVRTKDQIREWYFDVYALFYPINICQNTMHESGLIVRTNK